MMKLIAHLVWDDQGQDLIEYVLIGSFVSIAVLAGANALSAGLNSWYTAVGAWVTTAGANLPAGAGS